MFEYKSRHLPVYAALLLAALLLGFFLFPQKVMTLRDEANYLGVAGFLLEHHSLDFSKSLERHDGLIPWFADHNGRKVPLHPLGLSFLSLPFLALLGMKGAYLLQLLLFFLGGFFFERLLARRGLPSAYLLLYFLFPPFILYSRFFLADMPSVTCCLGALYFLHRKEIRPGTAFGGMVCLGMAFVIKPVNALFIAPLALWALSKTVPARTWASLAVLTITGAGFVGLQLALNHAFTGHALEFSYQTGAMFGPENIRESAPFYLLALGLCYPAMLAGLWPLLRNREGFLLAAFGCGFLFYSFFSYIDYDANPLLSLVRGQRYLLPYDAILLLGYAALLNRWRFFDGLFRRLFVPLILLACLAYLGLGMKLHKFASDNRTMLDWIYSHVREDDDAVIIYNTDSAEFIHGLYGKRNYRMIFSGEEFEAVYRDISGSYKRILISETNHPYRKGPHYLDPLLKSLDFGDYTVEAHLEKPPFNLLLLSHR